MFSNINTNFRGKYEICSSKKSANASDLYMELRYETFSECRNPCTTMKVNNNFKYKTQKKEIEEVRIIFPSEVQLSEEIVTKSLFSTSKYSESFGDKTNFRPVFGNF